ncbi:hypothetical protein DENSPDRAFT_831816 [Dentipellis sp. KUC8613]|nr:hypothetical protein DENSPDRAFT_831816 [Dentipellis sp. KUC8613]
MPLTLSESPILERRCALSCPVFLRLWALGCQIQITLGMKLRTSPMLSDPERMCAWRSGSLGYSGRAGGINLHGVYSASGAPAAKPRHE